MNYPIAPRRVPLAPERREYFATAGRLKSQIVGFLQAQPRPCYLVGGSVRDLLLDRPTHDVDVTVPYGALQLARELANRFGGAFVALDSQRDTGRAVFWQADETTLCVDVAGWRGTTLADDLLLRDFTVNALAVDLKHPQWEVLDVTGGLDDLERRLIRVPSEQSLIDDPLRGLRAVRLGAELAGWSFRLERDTGQLVARHAPRLVQSASERVRDELVRILSASQPGSWLRLMGRLGQLAAVLPEADALQGVQQSPPHVLDGFEHTAATLDHVAHLQQWLAGDEPSAVWFGPGPLSSEQADGLLARQLAPHRMSLLQHLATQDSATRTRGQMLRWSALCHDWGKPADMVQELQPSGSGRTRFLGHESIGAQLAVAALQRLRFNDAESQRVGTVVRNHMRPLHLDGCCTVTQEDAREFPSRRAVYRFFRDCGSAGVEAALLSLADLRATYGPELPREEWLQLLATVAHLLDAYFNQYEAAVEPVALVSGRDLMDALKLEPGPLIGRLLADLKEAQAVGGLSSRSEALQLAAELLVDQY